MKHFLLPVLLLGAGQAQPQAQTQPRAQAQTQAQTPGTPATERELLLRALSYGDAQVTPLPGRLPADFKLALPAGSRLLGSVVTTAARGSGMNTGASLRVFFDHTLPATQVREALVKTLKGAGYQPMPRPTQAYPGDEGGFQPSTPALTDTWYRRNPDEVLFFTLERAGEVTRATLFRETPPDLGLRLQMGAGGPYASLPKLAAPAGASVSPQGGGSSGEDANQSARIETSLSLAALFDHYAAQLAAAGWTPLNRSQDGKIKLGVWRTKAGGLGLFSLTEVEKGTYRGMVAVVGAASR